jgi:hypothetical protein
MIPTYVQRELWEIIAYPNYPYMAQCYLCSNLCRIPDSIRYMYRIGIDCPYLKLDDCKFRRVLLVLEHGTNIGLFCDHCYPKANTLVINETYRRDTVMIDEDTLSKIGI